MKKMTKLLDESELAERGVHRVSLNGLVETHVEAARRVNIGDRKTGVCVVLSSLECDAHGGECGECVLVVVFFGWSVEIVRTCIEECVAGIIATQVSMKVAAQDDDGQPHSNDLLDNEDFPFAAIVARCRDTLRMYVEDPDELELYDAFTLHYDERQSNTTFNRHRDPSHVTVNVCLNADCEGSEIEFFGSEKLIGSSTTSADETPDLTARFYVTMRSGTALIHYGRHLHQTRPLTRGTRSQAVLYYSRKGIVADNEGMYLGYED